MFCTKCGIEVREEDRFCGRCGNATREGYAPPYGRAAARLSRPMDQKKIAGVCAGFARYLDVDVTLVRILWLAVAISTGAGFIAYIVAWILMPCDYPKAAAQCCQPASQPG